MRPTILGQTHVAVASKYSHVFGGQSRWIDFFLILDRKAEECDMTPVSRASEGKQAVPSAAESGNCASLIGPDGA